MNEREIEILDQYDFEVNNMYKGRGFWILETTKGPKSFRTFHGSIKKLQFQDIVQQKLDEEGMKNDRIVRNKEGELISRGRDETSYMVREWFGARECNIREEREIYEASETMACMHRICRFFSFPEELDIKNYRRDMRAIFDRHNREMKKARNFMRERSGKTDFEVLFLKHFPEYLEKGVEAGQKLEDSDYDQLSARAYKDHAVCHGTYNHHNAVFENDKIVLLDFERCHIDVQMDDLYDFMRKIMEKWDWDIRVGRKILEHYNKIRPISEKELEYLKVCLNYPEKIWKLANHYYNSRKSWIPDKNMEKLQKVIGQEEKKKEFLLRMG